MQPELPNDTQEPQPHDIKSTAQSILDLNAEEFAKLQYLEKRHSVKERRNREIRQAIQEIDSYIMSSITLDNELWTRDANSTWALLRALQKRLAPTDHSRKAEIIKSYNALKRYDKNQSVERFLYDWERVYGLAIGLNLPDVMEERPLYDFALSLVSIDETFATNLELRVDENVRRRVFDTSVELMKMEDIIEEFRNFYNRHKSMRQDIIPAAFATSHNGNSPDRRVCLCGNTHLFKDCFYLNPAMRPTGWSGKESTFKKINEALADPRRVKLKTLISNITEYDGGPKETEKSSLNLFIQEDDTEELQNSNCSLSFATLAANDSENDLRESWILDGGSDIHICNDALKWKFETVRKARRDDMVRVGNSSIKIESFGCVKLLVDTPQGKKHITLRNVALANGFITNIVSMQLLNDMGFHWSSRSPTRLEREDHSLACHLYQNGGHILFNNIKLCSSVDMNLCAQSTNDQSLRTVTEAKLHRILAHPNQEVLKQIHGPAYGINID
ncbi:Ribonuclease h-like domain, partial [Thalictrum thalictroides]